eukprot:CCRYP_016956-RA/>CCRYP_016956-RA protein AED:0.11 eAED:0.08 QI:0/-1/0/1/-1/0/1/0/89
MLVMQVTIACRLGRRPGALAFSRNMLLNFPLIVDWQAIVQCSNSMSMTTFAVPVGKHDYAPGQKVLKNGHDPTKLGVRTTGPYNMNKPT